MTTRTFIFASLTLSLTATVTGCDAGDPAGPAYTEESADLTYDADFLDEGKADGALQACGGIAGFPCPTGQKCLIKATHPDAMGVCVGKPAYAAWQKKCQLVKCMLVECPEGFNRVTTPKNCCGTCVPDEDKGPEGQCQSPSDCVDLIHILCVGSWSCEQGQCAYQCDGGAAL